MSELFEGQLCHRCKKPIGRHQFTGLGAIRCYDMPANSGLTPWYAHKFVTLDGKPYMSILEQIGALAGLLEERGLPDAYVPAMDSIHHLIARLSGCTIDDVQIQMTVEFKKPKKEKTLEEAS